MLVIINPHAGGGTAMRKWRSMGVGLVPAGSAVVIDGADTGGIIGDALARGEEMFIAAGGDGTLNNMINALLPRMTDNLRQRICVGAIGLGSSNDFHKPFRAEQIMGGIPVKIDRERAYRRDVGKLTLSNGSGTVSRHFLVNASIGVTADANRFFNSPDRLLSLLKRIHTPSAILYTALHGILSHENIPARLSCARAGEIRADITNLSILKSPHLSGSLTFDGEPSYGSGTVAVRLAFAMDRGDLVRMLVALMRHEPLDGTKTRSWTTREITISADRPFVVEFDGEILPASEVRVSVLPQHLWVCS
jgi:diacylglycerol kinase family enzyme